MLQQAMMQNMAGSQPGAQNTMKGLLGNNYQSPMQGGLLGAAQAIAPMSGYTKTPVSMGQVLGAAGGGYQQGRNQAMMQNMMAGGQMQNMQAKNLKIQQIQAQMKAAQVAAQQAAGQRAMVANLRANPDYKDLASLPDSQFMAEVMKMRDPMYGKYVKKPGEVIAKVDGSDAAEGGVDHFARAGLPLTQAEMAKYYPNATAYESYHWDDKGVTPKRQSGGKGAFEIESNLSDGWKPYKTMGEEVLRGAHIVGTALEKRTGPSDIVAIKSFERMIEKSVVRSDDVAMQAGAVGLRDRAMQFLANWKEGDLLSDTTRSEMQQMANEILSITMEQQVMPNLTDTIDRADNYKGVRRSKIITDKQRDRLLNWEKSKFTFEVGDDPDKVPDAVFIADGRNAYNAPGQTEENRKAIQEEFIKRGLSPNLLRQK